MFSIYFFSDSDTVALQGTKLQGCTSYVFSKLAEAQEECEKLPQSKGFMYHGTLGFGILVLRFFGPKVHPNFK